MTSIDSVRHMRSTYADIRALFNEGITVSHVAETLKPKDIDEDPQSVLEYMRSHDFDVAAISENGVVTGYVPQVALASTGSVHQSCTPFTVTDLIADSTPLLSFLRVIHFHPEGSPRMFVLTGNQVTHIVTRGDLQKAPVRMLLFALISLLEMQMLRIIRERYRDDQSWMSCPSPERIKCAKKILSGRERRKEQIDLLDCLQFCDKRDIIAKAGHLYDGIGFDSKAKWDRFAKRAEIMRNALAHSQKIGVGYSSTRMIALALELDRILPLAEGYDPAHI